MSEDKSAENGKDGAADPIFETIRSEDEESLKILGLEKHGTANIDTRESDEPEHVHQPDRMIVRLGDSFVDK